MAKRQIEIAFCPLCDRIRICDGWIIINDRIEQTIRLSEGEIDLYIDHCPECNYDDTILGGDFDESRTNVGYHKNSLC